MNNDVAEVYRKVGGDWEDFICNQHLVASAQDNNLENIGMVRATLCHTLATPLLLLHKKVVFGFGGLEQWNGLDWNGVVEWNGTVEW